MAIIFDIEFPLVFHWIYERKRTLKSAVRRVILCSSFIPDNSLSQGIGISKAKGKMSFTSRHTREVPFLPKIMGNLGLWLKNTSSLEQPQNNCFKNRFLFLNFTIARTFQQLTFIILLLSSGIGLRPRQVCSGRVEWAVSLVRISCQYKSSRLRGVCHARDATVLQMQRWQK